MPVQDGNTASRARLMMVLFVNKEKKAVSQKGFDPSSIVACNLLFDVRIVLTYTA
jgi:hypothetical protein